MIVNNVIATGNETQQSTMLYKQNAAAYHALGLCFLWFNFKCTFVRLQLLNVNDFSVLVRQEACYSVLLSNLHNAAIWWIKFYIMKSSASGSFAPRPPLGLHPWTPVGDLRSQTLNFCPPGNKFLATPLTKCTTVTVNSMYSTPVTPANYTIDSHVVMQQVTLEV